MKYSKIGWLVIVWLISGVGLAQTCPHPLVVKEALNEGGVEVWDLGLSYTQVRGPGNDIKEISFQDVNYAIPRYQVNSKGYALSCVYNTEREPVHLFLNGRYQIATLGFWARGNGNAGAEVYRCKTSLGACVFNVIKK